MQPIEAARRKAQDKMTAGGREGTGFTSKQIDDILQCEVVDKEGLRCLHDTNHQTKHMSKSGYFDVPTPVLKLTNFRADVLAALAKRQDPYTHHPRSKWRSVVNAKRWLVRAGLMNRAVDHWELTPLGKASLDARGPWR